METNLLGTAQSKQPIIFNHFMDLVTNNRLAHAYLLAGENGAGQFEVALGIAMRLFCLNVQDSGAPCGTCSECRRIMELSHPDVVITKPDGQSIKVDQIRYVKGEFNKSAVEGTQKVFIIQGADKMTTGAANSLLKFIEEPFGKMITFLITDNKNLMLPTIISRTQVVEFQHLNQADFNEQLKAMNVKPSQMRIMAKLTNSIAEITEWQEDDWFDTAYNAVTKWYQYLASSDYRAFVNVQTGIIPVSNTKKQQKLIVEMLILIWQDTLNYKYQQNSNELKFGAVKDSIVNLSNRLTATQLLKIMELLLAINSKMMVNVNFQNIIEALTLEILTIIEL